MGYKSFFRSVSAVSNKIQRANERAKRQQQRELHRKMKSLEKLQHKAHSAEGKMENIIYALEDLYAKGKIDQQRYNELKLRKNHISIDLVVLGKTPAISLAKRYITGAIEKEEFDRILQELLPSDLFDEKQLIKNNLDSRIGELKQFRDECLKRTGADICQHCGKAKSFFDHPKLQDGFMLCKKCTAELNELKNYKGFSGKYFTMEPMDLNLNDIDQDIRIQVNFRQDLL